MNSKERILTVINHEEADKVPVDSWLAPEISDSLVKMLNIDISKDRLGLQKVLGNDVLYITLGIADGFNSIFKEERKIGDNLYQDQFGIKWKKQNLKNGGAYCEFAEHPLADIKNYDNYKWPDPLKCEKEGLEATKKNIRENGKEYAIMSYIPCITLEGSWYLRGSENFYTDLYKNQDFVEEILFNMMNYHLELSKEVVKMGVDIISWGDDIACEKGPIMSPEMYRKFIKPLYKILISEVKKINKDIIIGYHSDGMLDWAFDDIIDLGIEIINPLQPDANDIREFKKRYGKKLTVWGNVDTRQIMSNGTAADVVDEVRNVIEVLAPGGGLILCTNHAVQATKRSLNNTITYYWSAEKFGNYPINLNKIAEFKKIDWMT